MFMPQQVPNQKIFFNPALDCALQQIHLLGFYHHIPLCIHLPRVEGIGEGLQETKGRLGGACKTGTTSGLEGGLLMPEMKGERP